MSSNGPDASPNKGSSRIAYLPGLDGLRAVAVLAIISYHSGFTWLKGGFYSVDTFFTLSGFLITTLLIAEWNKSHDISLRNFWIRRARRLLPALFLMLIGLGILTLIFPTALASPNLKSDSLATLFYFANWHFIFANANYFVVTSKPSALLHTWTLAIEEQFYIVWPIIVTLVLMGTTRARQRFARKTNLSNKSQVFSQIDDSNWRRTRLRILFVIAVFGALASAVLMALLFHSGQDPTRVYYGTDTRAQSLLAGAALAIGLELWSTRSQRWQLFLLPVIGVLGAGVTALIWNSVSETSAIAFRGGFLVASISSCAVISCVAQVPNHFLTKFLSLPPLTYLGKISYSVYLWYWPTLLVISYSYTNLSGFWLFIARVATVVAIATISYYLVEKRIRRGALHGYVAGLATVLGVAGAITSIFVTSAFAQTTTTSTVAFANNPNLKNSVDLPLSNTPSSTATTSLRLKVLLLGDSMAGTLGVGLQAEQSSYNIELVNEGSPGCSLAMDGDFKVLWYTSAPGKPCVANQPSQLLNVWKSWVNKFNPDVVIYFARADLMDQSIGGTFEHIGEPNFDQYLVNRFDSAIRILSSKGAHVILISSPYYDSGTQPSGAIWPEDNPNRVVAYNKLLDSIAQSHGSTVSYLDINSILAPNNKFVSKTNNYVLRCNDGVHLTKIAGELLSKLILTQASKLGRAHAATSPSGSWPGYKAGPPSWYSQLHCLSP